MANHIDKLKDTADKLGVVYSPNIGAVALEKKIVAFEEFTAEKDANEAKAGKAPKKKLAKPRKLTDLQVKILLAKDLKKVKIVNLDPQNNSATTVTSGVHNVHMDLARVIPLGVVIPVEQALRTEIESRRYITAVPELDKHGEPTGNFTATEAPAFSVTYV